MINGKYRKNKNTNLDHSGNNSKESFYNSRQWRTPNNSDNKLGILNNTKLAKECIGRIAMIKTRRCLFEYSC